MKEMSRRDLLFKALRKPDSVEPKDSEIVIGRISNFPLGEKTRLSQFHISIESLPEGLRAQSCRDENQYFAIHTNQFGELVVNCSKEWPAEALFSVLTNEPEGL